jgi:hypothetical protein
MGTSLFEGMPDEWIGVYRKKGIARFAPKCIEAAARHFAWRRLPK